MSWIKDTIKSVWVQNNALPTLPKHSQGRQKEKENKVIKTGTYKSTNKSDRKNN